MQDSWKQAASLPSSPSASLYTRAEEQLTFFGVEEQLEVEGTSHGQAYEDDSGSLMRLTVAYKVHGMRLGREKGVPCTKEGARKDVSPVVPVVVDTADTDSKCTQERQEHKHGLVDKAFAAVQVELAGQVQRQEAEPRECPCAQGSRAEELRGVEPQVVPELQVSGFNSG
eukprot:SM000008S22349  [mRNA]  locus=s8:1141236:1142147:- [translate_table: standard]